ncbi:hypothetical protein LCM10_03000 [Rossellomorea aquimaris]|nr:hypothetical protein [Rossellomorea aquimaris]MCA1053942.1 hypothetical protein [Rossellomorea aquimaris]
MSNKNKKDKEKEVPKKAETDEHSIWDSFWKLTKPEVDAKEKEETNFKWF